jgi:hypothetical protein
MSADIVKFGEAAAQFERDRKVFRMRVDGVSVRGIADTLGIGVDQVHTSIARMTGGASPELRMREMLLDLERLDKMLHTFQQQIIGDPTDPTSKPDPEAAGVVLRCLEQRARLLGLYAQPRAAGTSDPLDAATGPKETTTERLKRALNMVRGDPVTIDAEPAGE